MVELQPDLDLSEADAERILEAWLGRPVACSGVTALKGGMVNTVLRLDFDLPPHHAVVKLHGNPGSSFADEAQALEYLGAHTNCPVPSVYLQDSSSESIPLDFLLLEQAPGVAVSSLELDPSERADLDRQLADMLADLHEHTADHWGGLDAADRSATWADLFATRIAGARAHPAVAERLSPDVLATVDRAIELVRPTLRDPGEPTLVHGDVWDGNLMAVREEGRWRLSAFLDPDLQFADVEYELAYLEVFDNRQDEFFAAYTKRHALRDGYENRRLLYWLHTGLVHVGLFGDEFFCEFTAETAEEIAS